MTFKLSALLATLGSAAMLLGMLANLVLMPVLLAK